MGNWVISGDRANKITATVNAIVLGIMRPILNIKHVAAGCYFSIKMSIVIQREKEDFGQNCARIYERILSV